MPSLIRVCNSDGCRGCDAKCYNAKGGICDCVCGGANHGIGRKAAEQNISAVVKVWLKEAGYSAEEDARGKTVLTKETRAPIEYPA